MGGFRSSHWKRFISRWLQICLPSIRKIFPIHLPVQFACKFFPHQNCIAFSSNLLLVFELICYVFLAFFYTVLAMYMISLVLYRWSLLPVPFISINVTGRYSRDEMIGEQQKIRSGIIFLFLIMLSHKMNYLAVIN